MKIRDDLEGFVHVRTEEGGVVVLKAGDTVPADAEVGDHLIEGKAKEDHEPSPVKRRGGRPRQGTGSSGAGQS